MFHERRTGDAELGRGAAVEIPHFGRGEDRTHV
jgi:hypothetical protein